MALHGVFQLVVCHGYIAIIAFKNISAATAGNKRGVPPAVHEKYSLLAFIKAGLQRVVQRSAEYAGIARCEFRAHIRYFNGRHGKLIHPVRHFQQSIFALFCP